MFPSNFTYSYSGRSKGSAPRARAPLPMHTHTKQTLYKIEVILLDSQSNTLIEQSTLITFAEFKKF